MSDSDGVKLKIKLNEGLERIQAPSYAHPGDAGLDLRASKSIGIPPLGRAVVPCGFSMAIPYGYGGFVLPRSGLAAKHGVTVLNSPGLIDSGYRGEVKVVLLNTSTEDAFHVEIGDRIAQMVIMRTPEVELSYSDELDITMRGEGGFGSSGVS